VAILANSAPLRDDRGAVVGAVEVFQDINTIKEWERQREQFLATVSHDLKNPLTRILGMSQLLEPRFRLLAEPDRPDLAEGLGRIGEAARQMVRQIDELLDITRMQMGQLLQLDLAPTDVVALVARLVEEYQRTTERHTLRLEHGVDTLVSMVDPARLQRALANVFSNAIKYSPQGGEVSTRLVCGEDHAGPWFAISVADQGVGIPHAEVDRVFESFYRASNVTGWFTGTGLGLRGVRQIVEQHAGTVALESTEGVGTRVTLRLPLVCPPSETST
jgi:signal transduction histidine kinase